MRAYGLLKNIVLACLILFLSLVPLGTNLVAYRAGIQGEIVPLIGCLQSAAFPQELYIGHISHHRYLAGHSAKSVLLVVNTLDLLFSVLPAFNVAVNVNFMLQLIQPLTSILISHFLLDLQEAYRRTLRLNSDDPLYTEASIGGDQQLGSLNFAHVVGSLGAVIDHSATGEDLVVGEDE
ncbi:hypothetical protein LXA43DRAFT_1068242 [Ganoderma leucocontextum]|nr:hypothetical protein LXA43DRAFT_1068242 [Ganoderma leucocontextum]